MPDTTASEPFIRLLGGAALEIAGAPATGRAAHRHRIALLALLVLQRGRVISRDKLIGYLWPERDADAGRNLLKVAVHGLRKEFGDTSIRTAGDGLSADLTLLRSDVSNFLDAVDAGNDEVAVACYGGAFLDGFFIKDAAELERWAESQRSTLAALYISALERLAQRADAARDFESAIRWNRAILEADPYRADVAQQLVRTLVALGDRASAIQFGEAFVRRRAEDLSIGDEEGIVQLARIAPAPIRIDEPPAAATVAATIAVEAPPISEGRSRPSRTRLRYVAGGIAIVLAALAGVAIRSRNSGPNANLRANTIAILPFRVSGADPTIAYLQDGMSELLAAEFTGEGGANAIDPGTVARTIARTARSGTDMDQESALAIARELGADQVLVGSVVGTRSRMTITASILNVARGDVRARTKLVEGSSDSLAALVGTITAQLLARDAGAWRLSANEPGTTSTAALRAFIDGRRAYKRGLADEAFESFDRAINLDSSFALAAYWLTVTSKLSRPLSQSAADRAYRLVWHQQSRLGFDRRELLRAMLGPGGPNVQTSFDQTHQAVERAANHQPGSPEAWFLLGDLYFHRGSLLGVADWRTRAQAAFEHAVALDTVVGSVSHLATLAFMERDMSAHAKWLQQLERLAPNDNYTLRERYAAAVVAGNAENLHQAREQWVRDGQAYRDTYDGFPWAVSVHIPPEEIDSLLATLTALATTDDQRSTTTYFTKSVVMNEGQPARAEQARRQYYGNNVIDHDFDLVTYAENDSAAAERLFNARGKSSHLPNEQYCEAVLSRLRREDTTGAAAVARTLRIANNPAHPDAPVCAALIDAIVSSIPPGASTAKLVRVDSLLRTCPPGMPSIWTYDLALAYARRGDYRAAAAAAGRRMIPRSARLAVSLRDEGRWAVLAGDPATAIRAWRQYLVLRSRPEPSMMGEVTAIKGQLSRIEGKTTLSKGTE